jgi:hypothetical protein
MSVSAVSSRELLPLDVRRKTKSTSPRGLTPMKKEAGSARMEATGSAGEESKGRCCKLDAISSLERKTFGKSETAGRGRIGISVSAEKIEGMPLGGVSEASDGFNSGARFEKEGL